MALAVFLVGSLLCGLAWSVPSLVLFRVLKGLGGGMILPLTQLALARAAGPDRLGRTMSDATSASNVLQRIGAATGTAVMATVLSVAGGGGTTSTGEGFRHALIWMFGLTVAGMLATCRLPGSRRPPRV